MCENCSCPYLATNAIGRESYWIKCCELNGKSRRQFGGQRESERAFYCICAVQITRRRCLRNCSEQRRSRCDAAEDYTNCVWIYQSVPRGCLSEFTMLFVRDTISVFPLLSLPGRRRKRNSRNNSEDDGNASCSEDNY